MKHLTADRSSIQPSSIQPSSIQPSSIQPSSPEPAASAGHAAEAAGAGQAAEAGQESPQKQSLTTGPVGRGLFFFLLPLMLGQFLQQLYNLADAWVIGNFADNASFAAVTSCGSLTFLIIGFFTGLSTGAGVIIARHYGAKDYAHLEKAIHTTVLFGILASIAVTLLTTLLVPQLLRWMQTPDNVLPYSITYFRVYCLGISTVIMYNMFMAIMRALGDSIRPLIFLCISSVLNVVLDLLFVAVLQQGVFGAALATVIAQGISAILCFLQMQKSGSYLKIRLSKLRLDLPALREICMQGLPAGIQNSALSLGNVVIQSNINSFGEFAMAGQGAYAKIEGFVFIPVISISMALATFVSQNRGANEWGRLKKGSLYAVLSSMIIAQLMGVALYLYTPCFMTFFTASQESIRYGTMFCRTLTLFYIPLSFSHAASGIMQGLGKSIYAMANMLCNWCIVRILYAATILKIHHEFRTLCLVYPLTWCLSTMVFLVLLAKEWKAIREREI